MISCTEFIPAYSELFSYIDETHGREEVDRFWQYLFAPTGEGIPLIGFVEREGIRGCFSYWSETLNEEAADFTMMLNEKAGWFKIKMHRCPSKGRLLTLAEEIGITPYRDYCLHCDSYRLAAVRVGLDYVYDFDGVDHAACSLLITDPARFDGRVIVDENTVTMDRRAADNEYFHRDFHSSMNMGIEYLGACYGDAAVRAYLTRYTENVYRKEIAVAALNTGTTRVLAAQAADEMLNICGITASFVLYPDNDQVIISARSIGDANVQMILEPLGGGGNTATAGAQVKNASVKEVLDRLVSAIDNFYGE